MGPARKEKCVSVNIAEGSWRSQEHFAIRYGDAELGARPAGMLPFFTFGMVTSSLCHCVLEVRGLLFDFELTQGDS